MTTLEPELLLSQSDWLRGLALGLLRDPERADDAVQDALTRALERPPVVDGDVGRLRAWFSRVLRNRDVSAHRRAARRTAREESVARTDHVPAVSAGIERAELSRDVVEAVLQLPDDLRDVVLLRYFEDLPPREIARRLELPGTTVRSRLQKGLARLRERLDRRYGQRDTWAVALSAVCTESSRVGIGSVVLAAAVALALAGGGLAWVESAPSPVPATDLPVVATQAAVEPRADEERPAAVTSSARRRAPSTAADQAAATVAPERRVAVRLIDESGRPLAGGRLTPAGLQTPSSEPTGSDGRAVLTLTEDARTLGVVDGHKAAAAPVHHTTWLTAWAPGRTQVLVGWDSVQAEGTKDEHFLGDVVLGPGGTVTGRVVDEDGHPVLGAWVEACDSLASTDPEERLAFGRSISLAGRAWTTNPRTDEDGRYRIDGLPLGRVTVIAHASGRLCDWQEVPIEVNQIATARELCLRAPGSGRTIAGRALDAAGRPLERTRAWLSDEAGQRLGDLDRTSSDGSFSFTAPAGRDLWLSFGARGSAQRHGPVRAGATELLVQLEEPEWITVTVRDQEGRAFERSWIRVHDLEGEELSVQIETDDADRVRFERPTRSFKLVAGAAGARIQVVGPFEPALTSNELALELARGPVVTGIVRAPGRSPAEFEVLALPRNEHGIGWLEGEFHTLVSTGLSRSTETDATGRFTLPLVEAGEYYVVARERPGVYARTELLSIHETGLTGIELELAPTGALVGTVRTAADVAVEGTVVAVSSGLTNLITTRTDAAGNYRFDELAPGPWQVRTIRNDRLSVVVQGRERRVTEELNEIPWDVVVEPNGRTRFDLDRTAERPFAFRGRLTFGGQAPVGWSGIARGRDEIHSLALDARGRFQIRLAEEGRVALSFWSQEQDGVKASIYGLLDVERGHPEWSLDLAVGSLDVTGLPPAEPFAEARPFERERGFDHALEWTSPEGWRWHVELSGLPGGSVRIENAPVGPIVLRHRRSTDSPTQFGLWPILSEIELAPGEDALLRVDSQR